MTGWLILVATAFALMSAIRVCTSPANDTTAYVIRMAIVTILLILVSLMREYPIWS